MCNASTLLIFAVSLSLVAAVTGYVVAVDAYYERELERLAQPFDPDRELDDPAQREVFHRILEAWEASSKAEEAAADDLPGQEDPAMPADDADDQGLDPHLHCVVGRSLGLLLP
jgi:hypothetical protein